jgi:hypothetical protein
MPADTADVDAASGKRSNWLFDTRRLRVYANPVTGVPVTGIGVPESNGGQPPPFSGMRSFFVRGLALLLWAGRAGSLRARRYRLAGTPTRSVRPPLIGVEGGRLNNRTNGELS